eukprot:COSAG02_NODE_56182_length_286_cov_1.796791_1_plen_45_part_01
MKKGPIDGTGNGDVPIPESEDRALFDAFPGVPNFWAHPVKFKYYC